MKLLSVSFATLMCVAVGMLPAYATAYDDLAKCERALASVHSYRAALQSSTGKSSVTRAEVVAPNRYHVTMYDGRLEFVVIGSRFWVKDKHGWRRLSLTPQMSMIGDLQRLSHLGDKTRFTVSDLGMRGGYHAPLAKERSGASQSVVYLRADHLPARLETRAGGNSVTITYSDNNAPITIQAPRV